MDEIYNEFKRSVLQIRQISDVYTYLDSKIGLHNVDFNDILRSQIVNIVSALDRYLHEKVRKGICDIFLGNRGATAKFGSFALSSETVLKIWGDEKLTDIQREILINTAVTNGLKTLSFQQSQKIKDALSYLWDEPHKISVIAREMGLPGTTDNDKRKYLIQKLDLLVERRNQIAHESDMCAGGKRDINQKDVEDSINFIEKFVNIINTHI